MEGRVGRREWEGDKGKVRRGRESDEGEEEGRVT